MLASWQLHGGVCLYGGSFPCVRADLDQQDAISQNSILGCKIWRRPMFFFVTAVYTAGALKGWVFL